MSDNFFFLILQTKSVNIFYRQKFHQKRTFDVFTNRNPNRKTSAKNKFLIIFGHILLTNILGKGTLKKFMNITRHAKERYAERIMGRDNKTDVAVFVAGHEKKIQEDIEKMVTYGTIVYTGKSAKQKDSTVNIIVKDLWVLIVDVARKNVVTLYKIDLGVGEEYDKKFVEIALKQIEDAKAEFEKKKEEIKNETDYSKEIEENNALITNYKDLIRKLESENQHMKELQNLSKTNIDIAEQDLREKVMVLTGQKIF